MKLSLVLLFFFLAGTFLPNFLTPAQGVEPQEIRPEEALLAPEESSEECTAPVVGADFSWQPVIPTVSVPVSFTATAWATITAWVTETITTVWGYLYVHQYPYNSLALDRAGRPHIVYCEEVEQGQWLLLRYARYNGSSWEINTIDYMGRAQDSPACSPALVLDAQDYPRLAYSTYFGPLLSYLKYVWYDGTFWWQQIVDRGVGDQVSFISLDLDARGHPHILYSRQFGSELYGSLRYALYNGSAWITETLDAVSAQGSALALDSSGYPHIVYRDEQPVSGLYYGYYDGTSWVTVSLPLSSCGAYYGPDFLYLAMDDLDLPHIACGGWRSTLGLKYLHYNGTGWTITTVDQPPRLGGTVSLALDSDDRPHIGYSLSDEYGYPLAVRYASYNGTSWITNTVDSTFGSGIGPSLALDAGGRPHISYIRFYEGGVIDLRYAYLSILPIFPSLPLTYTWSFGDGSTGVGETISHTYTLPGTYTVTLTATNCQSRTVVVSHTLEVHPCLPAQAAFSFFPPSPTAGVEITFTALPSGTLPIRHTWSFGDGGRAEGPIVYHTYSTGTYSLVLTATNCASTPSTAGLTLTVAPPCEPVHGVEMAWTPSFPKVGEVVTFSASLPAPTWLTRIVDTSGNAGVQASLVLDAFGRPYVAYLEGNTGRLRYARYNGRSWRVEEVDELESMGALSLALDGEGYPHLAYYSGYPAQDLRYARFDGTSWLTETVDASGNAGLYLSLALDGEGHPHIAYYEANAGDLRYARFDGASWLTGTVDAAGNAGLFASLSLDGEGHPHIAYYVDYPAQDLRYARYDGSAWHLETVDTSGDAGRYASLRLDGAGRPHIAYYEAVSGDLRYAYSDGSAWQRETVDAAGNAGLFASLGLDGAGYPHIAYYEAGAGDLRYAFWDGSTWHIEAADVSGEVGWYASLRLDGAGRPHVAYYGRSDGSLRYGRIPPEAGRPVGYLWDLGDGSRGEGEVLTHTYALPGVYTVTLTATNCFDGRAVLSRTLTVISVCHPLQEADFAWSPLTPTAGQAVVFSPQVSGTLPITCRWDFGDGSPVRVTDTSPVSHTYALSGTYTVRLTATNCLTATAVSSHTLTVLPPCEGVQLLTLSTAISGCQVSFQAEVSGTPPISYLWEFGDGITSTEESPVHLYPASGVYSGTLRLRNCGGEAVHPFTVAVECPVGWRIYLPLVLRTLSYTP